jgi:polyisoprenoid-binding protein YceI
MNQLLKTLLPISLLLMSSLSLAADWQIDNSQSHLSFISIKKQDIAEVHRLGDMSGTLSSDGEFSLSFDMESVDTGIAIRDSRMRTFLFKVAEFPQATLSANLSSTFIDNLTLGQSELMMVESELTLLGQSQPLTLDVLITKVRDDALLVTSAKPVILNTADYELSEGVEKLRELAGLSSISQAVPVSFYLTLNAK